MCSVIRNNRVISEECSDMVTGEVTSTLLTTIMSPGKTPLTLAVSEGRPVRPGGWRRQQTIASYPR